MKIGIVIEKPGSKGHERMYTGIEVPLEVLPIMTQVVVFIDEKEYLLFLRKERIWDTRMYLAREEGEETSFGLLMVPADFAVDITSDEIEEFLNALNEDANWGVYEH